ncbi:MAG: hypothetical protein V4515_14665 [Chloroflexota bacterium]
MRRVTVTLTVDSEGTDADVRDALEARLSEFYPVDGEVAVPTIEAISVETNSPFVDPPKFTDDEAREAFDTAHMAMHRAVNL